MKYFLSLTIVLSVTQLQAKTLRVDDSILTETNSEARERRNNISMEALEALRSSQDALSYFEKGNKKDALKSLANASGKLKRLMASDQSLELAPVDVRVETHELNARAETIEKVRLEASKALISGNIQRASELISALKSEAKITVTSIPLGSYPDAIRQASREIEKQDNNIARATLAGAFLDLAVEEVTYPIPVMKAEYFVEEAQRASLNIKSIDDEAVRVYARAAKEELKLAETLGYGMKNSFKTLYTKINELQRNPLKKENFYEDLKEEFANFRPSSSINRQAQEAE